MTSQSQDFITCKLCGNIDPLSKKFKCSKCGAKDWGHELPPKNKRGCLGEILIGITLIAGVLIYNKIKDYRNTHWSQSRIESKFSKNVVLVYHEFAYELKFDNPEEGSLYFIRTVDGGFTQWQSGMQANSVTGCGFVTEADGFCITAKNLTYPWPDDLDMIRLKREVQIFRNPPFNIKSVGHYKLFTIKLGYYPNGTKINDTHSFVPCKVFGLSEKELGGLTPLSSISSFKGITEFNKKIENHSDLNKGDKIYSLGFPLQINPSENLSTIITQSKIDSLHKFNEQHDELYYPVTSLYTLEGAPVFDSKGRVIGFNTFDEKGNIKLIWNAYIRNEKE